jgi:hypothetical protein
MPTLVDNRPVAIRVESLANILSRELFYLKDRMQKDGPPLPMVGIVRHLDTAIDLANTLANTTYDLVERNKTLEGVVKTARHVYGNHHTVSATTPMPEHQEDATPSFTDAEDEKMGIGSSQRHDYQSIISSCIYLTSP